MKQPEKELPIAEFVALVAMMTAILALAIDIMLPALGNIGADFELADRNNAQLVITSLFMGYAIGQLIAGPLSDIFGRKPVIQAGYIIFITGCVLSMAATSFETLIAGRILQGLGASAPRIVSTALVRDSYEGRAMARILSIVMAIFILVPALAPALGQLLLFVAPWRAMFGVLLVLAFSMMVWLALRQPETLPPSRRRRLSVRAISGGVMEALGYRALTGYTIAAGIVFGAFVGYLASAQQIFQEAYSTGNLFVIYFGGAALAIGAASLVNARLVMRLGMRFLTWRATVMLAVLSAIFLPVVWSSGGLPPLFLFVSWQLLAFFCVGILFGNFNTLALEPVGHMAGLGSAVVGAGTTFIALPLGSLIGFYYDGTIVPLVAGFASLAVVSLAVMAWTEGGKDKPLPDA